jgi:hypothetical protein
MHTWADGAVSVSITVCFIQLIKSALYFFANTPLNYQISNYIYYTTVDYDFTSVAWQMYNVLAMRVCTYNFLMA